MVHGKNRIPYRIDRRLTGFAGPDNDATISFGLFFELGDCPYGKSRVCVPLLTTHLSTNRMNAWKSRQQADGSLSA